MANPNAKVNTFASKSRHKVRVLKPDICPVATDCVIRGAEFLFRMKTTNKSVSREELENILIECIIAYADAKHHGCADALHIAVTATLNKEFPIPRDETPILL